MVIKHVISFLPAKPGLSCGSSLRIFETPLLLPRVAEGEILLSANCPPESEVKRLAGWDNRGVLFLTGSFSCSRVTSLTGALHVSWVLLFCPQKSAFKFLFSRRLRGCRLRGDEWTSVLSAFIGGSHCVKNRNYLRAKQTFLNKHGQE